MNNPEANESTKNENNTTEWDELTKEKYIEFLKNFDKEKAEEIEKYAKSIAHTNDQFVARNWRLHKDGKEMSKEELLRWEADIRDTWGYIKQCEESSMNLDTTENGCAILEKEAFPRDYDLTKDGTIEVRAASVFFYNRLAALRKEIRNKNDDNVNDTLSKINGLPEQMEGYMELKAAYDEVARGGSGASPEEVEWASDQRGRAHNKLLNTINELNDLCRENNLTPITVRNYMVPDRPFKFVTNDAREMRQYTDRSTVEAICGAIYRDAKLKEDREMFKNNPELLQNASKESQYSFFLHDDHFKGYWDDEESN